MDRVTKVLISSKINDAFIERENERFIREGYITKIKRDKKKRGGRNYKLISLEIEK